ncbi:MAG: DNA translocase FtsK 4TM domain-containing protein, partial [Pseudomonadota bacterium]
MGVLGAYCADVLIQIFGAGSLALAFGLLAWALRLWRHEQFGPLWARFSALLASAFFLSIAGATLPGYGWLSHVTMGGAGGVLAFNILTSWVGSVVDFYPHILVAMTAGAVGVYLLALGVALQRQESEAMVETFLSGGAATLGGASSLLERFRAWRNSDDDFAEDDDYAESQSLDPIKKPSRAAIRKTAKPQEMDDDDDTDDDEDYDGDDDEEDAIQVIKPHKDKDATSKKKSTQQKFNLRDASEWDLPPTEFLQEAPPQQKDEKLDESALRKNAEVLQNVLQDYNIKGDIKSIHPGPVVTLYELEPAPGTKTSRVVSLADDIARSMSAVSVRAAVVPGRNVIGIELPNKKRQTVYLRELMEGGEFEKTQMKLPLVLGKDIGGHPVIADLTRMPHLLVAGTTGSGKSVAVNTMILSLLYAHSPDKCRFIMIDPKMLELS